MSGVIAHRAALVAAALAGGACSRGGERAEPAGASAEPPRPPPIQARTGAIERDGERTIRRGTFDIGSRTYRFVLLGEDGAFGAPHQAIAIDLDGDGRLDLGVEDGPELIHLFENVVRIGETGYQIRVPTDGALLELVPLEHQPPVRPALVENTPAPTFRATARDGAAIALEELRGKIVLLDFWARSCRPCIAAMPHLRALGERHRDLRVVGVAATEDGDATGLDLPGTQVLDRDDEIQSRYRIAGWPTYFLIDRTGRIACARCRLDDIETMLPRM